ncbi:MAG: class I SAM-dependent methyltransferase, partial [Anaerolineae bacterium]
GGFYLTVRHRLLQYDSWTTIDSSVGAVAGLVAVADTRLNVVVADGSRMPFASAQFDTTLSVQVLEHVPDPTSMVREIARVLRPGGYAVFLVPQTSTIRAVPHHYYNFTRFWIEWCMECNGLEIVELRPLGGVWSSMASHLVFQYLQAARYPGLTTPECRRNTWFYVLYPFMALYALVSIPICMLFSLGDLTEEPNNHLVVTRKRF